jgi:hypothetical protein
MEELEMMMEELGAPPATQSDTVVNSDSTMTGVDEAFSTPASE